jgi:hypothetical protein
MLLSHPQQHQHSCCQCQATLPTVPLIAPQIQARLQDVISATYPSLQEATADWPATHLPTALGTDATTPQAPQLAALFMRSTSQPSDGSWLQSPNLQGTQADSYHVHNTGDKNATSV